MIVVFKVFFRSFVFSLIFYILVPSITEKGILKSATIIVDSFITFFSFSFIYFEAPV